MTDVIKVSDQENASAIPTNILEVTYPELVEDIAVYKINDHLVCEHKGFNDTFIVIKIKSESPLQTDHPFVLEGTEYVANYIADKAGVFLPEYEEFMDTPIGKIYAARISSVELAKHYLLQLNETFPQDGHLVCNPMKPSYIMNYKYARLGEEHVIAITMQKPF